MKIIGVDFYMDGGTAGIETDEGVYFVDRRLHTATEGEIFDKHPDEKGARIIGGVRLSIISALRRYAQSGDECSRRDIDAILQLAKEM